MSINKGLDERTQATIAQWAREQDAQHIAKLREEIVLTHLRHDFGTDGSKFLLKHYADAPEKRAAFFKAILEQRAQMTLDSTKNRDLDLAALGISKEHAEAAREMAASELERRFFEGDPSIANVSPAASEGRLADAPPEQFFGIGGTKAGH